MEKIDNLTVIKDIMSLYNLTQTEFATRIGVHQANLSEMMRGKRACGNGIMAKVRLAFPEINTNWLDTGEGEMLKPQPTVMQNNYNGNNNYVVGNGNNVQCSVEVADEVECPKCGEVFEAPSSAVVQVIPTEITKMPDMDMAAWIKMHPHKMENVDMARIWGDDIFVMLVDTRAMEPEYKEGTYLVLRRLPDLSYARADGTPYVVDAMRPHALLRYFTKERDGGYVLTAESDKRGPIYLRAEEIYGIYDIVGSFRIGR